jgi:HD-like signal output (HDOD) protein
VDRIELLLDRVAEVCPLPKTSGRLLELTRSDNASITAVATTIATDPALAASVLRIANSAVYGGGRIDRLESAVMRIGLRELHDMAAAMSLFAAFRNRGELLVAFHDRAVVSGAIAHRLAKLSGLEAPSVAFTCGLLAEIGAMACVSVESKEYTVLFRSAEHSLFERCERERERYGGSSFLIGGRFLERHRLPGNVVEAVASEPDADPNVLAPLPRIITLSRFASVILLRAGKTGDRAEAIDSLNALPLALRGAEWDGVRLFELCLEAGSIAEQTLRSGR